MFENPLLLGALLGATAAFAPGPIQALILQETLRGGRRAGLSIALSPLITDAPIVALSLVVLHHFASRDLLLGILSLTGAAFLVFLAYAQTRPQPEIRRTSAWKGSLGKGVLANFLNPHPYIFWMTVGGPIILGSSRSGLSAAPAFVFGFYVLLLGTFAGFSLAADRLAPFLGGKGQQWVTRILSLLLLVFALLLALEGLSHFEVI